MEIPDSGGPWSAPRADVAAFERLSQALVGITVQSLDALDGTVSVAQFRLLRTLCGLGRMPSSRLAAALETAASSVTRLADRLTASGLVARGCDPRNRSIVTLEVTDAGRELVEAVLTRRRRLLEAVLDTMAPEQRNRAAEAATAFVLLADDALAAGARSTVSM